MGRTVHYRTRNKVEKAKIKEIKKIIREINEKKDLKTEKIKIYKEGNPFGEGIWGFSKSRKNKEIGLVLESLKDISSKFPDLRWKISIEGQPKDLTMESGKIISYK